MTKRPIYYGWIIVLIGFACQFFIYGVRNSFSVFYLAILNDFGWSRADTALIFSINVVVYGFTSPFAGTLVDRFGPRKVMPVGILILALGTIACSIVSQIWHFYILFGLVAAIGSCLSGFVPNMAVLSHWFVKRRGAAFGIFTELI